MLTFLPLDKINALQTDMQQQTYRPNTAQRLLAEEVIRFVHGEEGLSAALSATEVCCPTQPASFVMCMAGTGFTYVSMHSGLQAGLL